MVVCVITAKTNQRLKAMEMRYQIRNEKINTVTIINNTVIVKSAMVKTYV